MQVRVPIGHFSRMTYLSIRALRLYHEQGLLEPALVDTHTGYRYYHPDQVPTAQVIRRLRNLGMPVDGIRQVIQAPDLGARNDAIVAHLTRMKEQLRETQAAVASLQSLLERPPQTAEVEHRSVPATWTLAIGEPVAMGSLDDWWSAAFQELHAALKDQGVPPAGPHGALFAREFFEEESGSVVAFVPVAEEIPSTGRTAPHLLPATELVVALHEGSFRELDRTYGALGTYVAEREIGVDGPIRETYLATESGAERTEVGWPVFHTRGADR